MKLRCGVVGLGRGKRFVKALAKIEDCQMVSVCDLNPAAFSEFPDLAAYTDYDKFLDEKLDVVAVISPGPLHAEQSLKALERGAHVICETPCVYSLDEARRIVATVKKTGLKYMLAENYLWMAWCEALVRMAREGKFGEIVYAEGDYTHDCRDIMLADEKGCVPHAERDKHPNAKPTWRASHLPPIQYCSHTLGPILNVMEDRIVSAYGLSIAGKGMPGVVPTDLESALFQTKKGAIIRLTNGFSLAHPISLYFNFVGTHGSVKFLCTDFSVDTVGKWWTEVGGRSNGWQDMPMQFWKNSQGRSDLEVMLEEFIESVRKDTDPPIDVYASMEMTIPGIVAHQSGAKGGVKLEVPDLRQF